MENISQNCFDAFITAANRVAEHGLVGCSSGNLSWRVNDGLMLITTTDSWMANLCRDDVAVCRIADAASIDEKTPSKEIGFHAGIMAQRPEVNVVLHFNSPCATTLACCEGPLDDFSVIPEIPYYIGPVASVPFLTPGSAELAQAVISAMREHDLAMLRNHGQVVVARDFDKVIAKASYFELACKIITTAPDRVRPMPKDAITELRQQGQAHRAKPST